MKASKQWPPFPYDGSAFDYAGPALQTQWARLHRCDCEPYPEAESLSDRLRAEPSAKSGEAVAAAVQAAWRAYHRGAFQSAFELGTQAGLAGFAVAVKAASIHASCLESRAAPAQALLLEAMRRAEAAAAHLPDDANAHYLLALALGRYSQRISVVEALAHGYASRLEQSLQRALQLQPRHCEAHIALGLYHAELVNKLGTLAARLTYGASRDRAIEHFERALKLAPNLPAARLEYAKGLRLLNERERSEADKQLRRALKCEPFDAASKLDVEAARALLQDSARA